MKKNLLILLILMLWASPAAAQQAEAPAPPPAQEAGAQAATPERLEEFDAKAGLGYWYVTRSGSTRAAEYEYLKSSNAGLLNLEWDQLPHRFVLESSALNPKDYFGNLDYSYRDVVVFDFYTRAMYHNLNHYNFESSTSTDRNPLDEYGIENLMRRAFVRFKTPDFPFHLYADVQTMNSEGTMQQRFMLEGGTNRVSQTRNVDWNTREVKVGMNSHLGYLEADLSHTEKTFKATADKVLSENYTTATIPPFVVAIPHNELPDLKSSSNTIKVHTTYSGRFVAAATYTGGTKKNEDSSAKADYKNMAGDLTFTPVHYLVFNLKYRHYDLTTDNPNIVTTSTLLGTTVFNVRDSLSSKRDIVTGIVRYRLTARLTVKGEYSIDTTKRNEFFGNTLAPLEVSPTPSGSEQNFWDVAHSTTKTTSKAGLSYRASNKLTLRADYTALRVENPAYANDPDKVDSLKAAATWLPAKWLIATVSGGGVREKRNNLAAPLGGGNAKTDRDQALGSLTFLVGKRSSLTTSYAYFKNKTSQTFTYVQDVTGAYLLENGVPYGDKAEVLSLSAMHALTDSFRITADASRCNAKGNFTTSGTIDGTNGIAQYSDMKVVEDVLGAGVEAQLSKTLSGDVRYQQRHYDDKVDSTQDGRVSTVLATLSMKW